MIDPETDVLVSGRGFTHMRPLPDSYGTDEAVRVYESSAAMGPHVWLAVTQTWHRDRDERGQFVSPERTVEAHVHLTLETAAALAEQLRYLVEHHYQNERKTE